MSAATAAIRGRIAAERMMTDTCRVYREGTGTFDSTTGAITDAETTIYTGKCRVKQVPGFKTGGELVGETVVPRTAPIVSIPFSVFDVRAGDRVVLLNGTDASLLNRPLLIEAVHAGTHATARRLVCEGLD